MATDHQRTCASQFRALEIANDVTSRSSARNGLLQGKHDIRWGLRAGNVSYQRDVSCAKARWHYKVDLIEAGTGQSGEGRSYVGIINEELHRVRGWCGPQKDLPRWYCWTRWSETYTKQHNRVARFRGNCRVTKGCSGRPDNVIGASAISARVVGPENNTGHMFGIEKAERGCELSQSYRGC